MDHISHLNPMRIEVSGVWDLFHVGHARLIERAKALAPPGEPAVLLVGVHTDEVVAEYKRAPVIPYKQRAEMVGNHRLVDGVILDAPLHVTEEYMNKHSIDLVVHAHDEGDTFYDEIYKVPIQLGKFKRLDYTSGISTTEIINKIRMNYA